MIDSRSVKFAHLRFWLLPLALFVATMVPFLLMHGVPNADGYTTASMARNLAQGLGSFWRPYFSEFHQSSFYDHPALGISSLAWVYRVFGDHTYIEKIMSVIVTLLNWLLGCMIAKRFMPYLRLYNAWPLLLCWLLVLTNSWYYSSFMQEPIMNIFSYTALLAIIISYQRCSQGWRLFPWMLLAGVSTCIGVYIGGPLVLYVWLVEPCLFVVYRQHGISFHIWRCLLLIMLSIGFFAAFTPAHANFAMYWHNQVVAALSNHRIRSAYFGVKRLAIILMALESLYPIFIFLAICNQILRLKPSRLVKQHACFFLCLFVISTLPIIVSSKQFSHYALQGYLFMILAVSLVFMQPLCEWVESICIDESKARKIHLALIALLFAAIVWATIFLNNQSRVIGTPFLESQAIIQRVGHDATLSAPYVKFNNVLHIEAYLQRFGKINLKTEKKPTTKYLINAFPSFWEFKSPHYRLMPFSEHFVYAKLYQRIPKKSH